MCLEGYLNPNSVQGKDHPHFSQNNFDQAITLIWPKLDRMRVSTVCCFFVDFDRVQSLAKQGFQDLRSQSL
jgi:hypothetical protein